MSCDDCNVNVFTIKARRDACRECEWATKDVGRYPETKGLNIESVCLMANDTIIRLTAGKNMRCPKGHWQ